MKKGKSIVAALSLCLAIGALAAGCGTKKSPWSQYIELGEYKGISVSRQSAEVTEEEITQQMDKILLQNVSYEHIEKGKVKDGDTVNIDYEGKLDGVAFEGGTDKGADLIIGSNRFIDGFEKGLIDVEAGETVDLNLKFPEDYHAADLAGKDVVFTVKVNYIQGEPLESKWTEDFVKSISDFATVDEYKEDLKKSMSEQKAKAASDNKEYEVLKKVVDNCTIKGYPEEEMIEYKNNMRQQIEQQAAAYGQTYEQMISLLFNGVDEEEFEKQLDEAAKQMVAQNMALDTIAVKEKIFLSKEEEEEEGLAFVKEYGYDSVEAFETQNGEGIVKEELIRKRVRNLLVENAVESDTAGEEAAGAVETETPAEHAGKGTNAPAEASGETTE